MKEKNVTLQNQTILITGAAGFIGANLAMELLRAVSPAQIIGIDNLNDYYDVSLKEYRLKEIEKCALSHAESKWVFMYGSIADKSLVGEAFRLYKPAVVVNLAAQAGVRYSIDHPEAYVESNLIGFFNILECCRRYPVSHLLFASSSSVYGANKKVPYSTQDKTDQPVSLYAATKKSNELLAYSYCKLYGIPATGLRLFTVYGPYGRPDMAYFSFTRKILNGQAIQIFNHGDMYRDFTYVDDIVKGIRAMLFAAPGEDENGVQYKVYNIGNHHPEKLLDFVAILEECLAFAHAAGGCVPDVCGCGGSDARFRLCAGYGA